MILQKAPGVDFAQKFLSGPMRCAKPKPGVNIDAYDLRYLDDKLPLMIFREPLPQLFQRT